MTECPKCRSRSLIDTSTSHLKITRCLLCGFYAEEITQQKTFSPEEIAVGSGNRDAERYGACANVDCTARIALRINTTTLCYKCAGRLRKWAKSQRTNPPPIIKKPDTNRYMTNPEAATIRRGVTKRWSRKGGT